MNDRTRQRCALPALTGIAALVFLTGIGWGLPSRAVDPYLFGTVPPWTGAEIFRLAGDRPSDPQRGADVALHPIEDRAHAVLLNRTDRQRAEIVRRYRLYSYQPDEMLTLMSLAGMNPRAGDLDPRLYYYGGLFIYPFGATLKFASMIGLVDLRSNLVYYLDHPEAFGRFYIVNRFIVAMWGIVGAWVVYALMKRLTHGLVFPMLAGIGYVLLPVVVNMSHEGKPHLPGTVLMLLTVLMADTYVRTARRRWAIFAGAMAGASTGMVVYALLVFPLLPVMTLMVRHSARKRMRLSALAVAMGIIIYFVTNPYVAINLITNRAVLRSNFGNATSVYHVGGRLGGMANAIQLMIEGASPGVVAVGLTAAAWALIRWRRAAPSSLALLLAIPAGLQLIQFMALASGKRGDYGRFAIFFDIVLLMAAVTGLAKLNRGRAIASVILLVTSIGFSGGRYLIGFIRDCQPVTSRLIAAERIRNEINSGARSIHIGAEPAPYSLPPVDLFQCQLMLMPPETRVALRGRQGDLIIPAADDMDWQGEISARRRVEAMVPYRSFPPPAISWADRSFSVFLAGKDERDSDGN